MARRLKALLMLLLFGLILPVAGAPQRFCARELTFSHQDCCEPAKNCGGCPDDKSPVKPTCVISAKVIPDGVNNPQPDLPAIGAFLLPDFALPTPVEISTSPVPDEIRRDRAPPGHSPPLYLTHRSLLL